MIRKLNIDGYDIQLENYKVGQGKIIISGYNLNASYFWDAMGGPIEEFIQRINSDYFAGKLTREDRVFDADKTFTAVRKYIRSETYELSGWYKHMAFQKDMREKLKEFQSNCETEYDFVHGWDNFIRDLDYDLVENKFDSKCLKEELEGLSEIWNLIEKKPSWEHVKFQDLHKKLKKALKKNEGKIFNEILT